MSPAYYILNPVFHVAHITTILFTMFGWLCPNLRLAHLILVLLTFFSWYVLGQWLGIGYCPVTDGHWRLKKAFTGVRPDVSYIQLVLEAITHRKLNGHAVDIATLIGAIVAGVMSLVFNLRDFV